MSPQIERISLFDFRVETAVIEADSGRSFTGKLRDELLNGEIFHSLKKAQIAFENWRQEYKTTRPRSSSGYEPPTPVARLPHRGSEAGEWTTSAGRVQTNNLQGLLMLGGPPEVYPRKMRSSKTMDNLLKLVVELEGIEPTTSWMPYQGGDRLSMKQGLTFH
ncbi:transposase [Pseudodesulfovibrio cashew]|uniref:Transposase n=1 Tax=Pseudodesulfovibrio cashew TaxID=2678688 RepID=A0A6I6JWG2_9BACT|nr:transposase [Pseudodesulfovibrio cashew]